MADHDDQHPMASAAAASAGPLARLRAVLGEIPNRIVACSGGVDSLLLATVSHQESPAGTIVAHTVTPAVPSDGSARVSRYANERGWRLEIVRSREFEDERYLANPTDRCYFCKSNLYEAIGEIAAAPFSGGAVVLSGANTDDLGEYRPGLRAADEHGVRHPFLEAEMSKAEIRAVARSLGLDAAELPASPCLASRLYTGTRVTADRLQAIEVGEATVRELTGIDVVRCRVRETNVAVEVRDHDRGRITAEVLAAVASVMQAVCPELASPVLDQRPYRSGQAILKVQ